MTKKTVDSGMLPPGLYYVGDPVYFMTGEEYKELVSGNHYGKFELSNGMIGSVHPTMWGDGCYTDQYGREYYVDSASLCCIRVGSDGGDIPRFEIAARKLTFHFVEFAVPFTTSANTSRRDTEDGEIRFGHIKIDTM